jgi:hypothetical protein
VSGKAAALGSPCILCPGGTHQASAGSTVS